jgi:hypothetical protein
MRAGGGEAGGHDQEMGAAVVEAGDGVPEVNGDAVGQACRDLQKSLLAFFSELI